MGCFSSNCCITGLPIEINDEVRTAILTPEKPSESACYVGGAYQFYTFPISSTYDDYGGIEWEDIKDEHRWDIEYILKLMLPNMKDHEDYSRKVFDNGRDISLETLWKNTVRGEIDFDPDRDSNNEWKEWRENGRKEETKPQWFLTQKPIPFQLWMCHEWAYDHVLKSCEIIRYEAPNEIEAVENYCYTHTDFSAEVEGLNRDIEEDKEKWMQAFQKSSGGRGWIEGEQGGISPLLRRLLQGTKDQTEFIENRDIFKKRLLETMQFCSNLHFIRKIITPINTFGGQHEDWDFLPKWTALIASKAEEKRKEQEEYYRN